MGVLRMGPKRGAMRSVYTESAITDMFEANPYADSFRLSIKIGRANWNKQSISVTFKSFNHPDCLKTILQFARLMWKTEECGRKQK